MADDRESTTRWFIGVTIAVVGILISAIVTLIAADRLGCPSWLCRADAPPAQDVQSGSLTDVFKEIRGYQ